MGGPDECVQSSAQTVPRRGRPLKNPPAPTRLEIRYGDLDPYGHVNNAVYLEFFEKIRLDYWRALADLAGIDELEAGDVPGARYVIAETTVRFKGDLPRRHPPRRGPHAHRRQPLLHHGLRAAHRRDLRETARSSRRAPPPTSSSTPYRTPSNRAPTGSSPP